MQIRILAVPYDSALRDFRMGAGPARLLESGLADHLRERGHRLEVEWIEADGRRPHGEIRTAFEIAGRLGVAVRRAAGAGEFPLVLAGNCNTAVGTLAGVGREDTGAVWFDAHGDLNTPETTASGFLDGMALATASGRCWTRLAASVPGFHALSDERVLLVGARDLDPAEAELLARSAIRRLSADATRAGLEPALDALATRVARVYVHLDLDVLDPGAGRANAFAAPGGLDLATLADALGSIRRRFRVAAAALTAYDPACDPEGRVCRAAAAALDALLGEVEAPNLAAGETSPPSAR